MENLKFPIGHYTPVRKPSTELLEKWITDISSFPSKLKNICGSLSAEELNWQYRPEGWTIKQVVHHCADSHMNALIRFKLALTERNPIIKPYYEAKWAELADGNFTDIGDSLNLLAALHKKWTLLLKSLDSSMLEREFIHPEYDQTLNLAETVGNYAWHCNHHFAHVKNAIAGKGKFFL